MRSSIDATSEVLERIMIGRPKIRPIDLHPLDLVQIIVALKRSTAFLFAVGRFARHHFLHEHLVFVTDAIAPKMPPLFGHHLWNQYKDGMKERIFWTTRQCCSIVISDYRQSMGFFMDADLHHKSICQDRIAALFAATVTM
jgi:hypothetical protein